MDSALRPTLCVKEKWVVGFQLAVDGLDSRASLQTASLGDA
jgi:hypothetical protein